MSLTTPLNQGLFPLDQGLALLLVILEQPLQPSTYTHSLQGENDAGTQQDGLSLARVGLSHVANQSKHCFLVEPNCGKGVRAAALVTHVGCLWHRAGARDGSPELCR